MTGSVKVWLPFKDYTKLNKSCTFTVTITMSPVASRSIEDATEMTPSSLEMLNKPSAVESVKQRGRNQHLTQHTQSAVAITPEGGDYNLQCCRL